MKKLLILLVFLFLGSCECYAQTEPKDNSANSVVTISQADANKLYDLASKGKMFDAYKAQAEADIKQRDSIIEDLKIKYAVEVQRGSDKDAELVRLTAVMQFLMQMSKSKKIGLINF